MAELLPLALKVVGSLCVVLVSFGVLVLILRKTLPVTGAGDGRGIDVLATLSLQGGARLLLIRSFGRRYLVGLSSAGFQLLDRIDDGDEERFVPGAFPDGGEDFDGAARDDRSGAVLPDLPGLLRLDRVRERLSRGE